VLIIHSNPKCKLQKDANLIETGNGLPIFNLAGIISKEVRISNLLTNIMISDYFMDLIFNNFTKIVLLFSRLRLTWLHIFA
jgi:hypothetical protein